MQALVSISRYLGRQGKKSELAIPRRYQKLRFTRALLESKDLFM